MTARDTPRSRPNRHSQRAMMLAGFGIPMLASRLLGPWADALLPAVLGAAFLVSIIRHRPLLTTFAERRAAGNPGLAARLRLPHVASALSAMTVVWGFALIGEAALLVILAGDLPANQFGPISTALGVGIPAAPPLPSALSACAGVPPPSPADR